jgi:hypothetical protein
VWQGTALGCPEPLIQEVVKHHDYENILPYHGYLSSDSYPGSSYPGSDYNGVYSLTPGLSDPTQGYPTAPSAQPYVAPTYLPPVDNQYGAPQVSAGADGQYPSRRYKRDNSLSTGRQISDKTQTMISEMIFTFLGVDADVCRKRFVCELEFRNPQLRNAIRFIG